MSYFTQTDLEALIPPGWLTEGLDDDADGTQDAFAGVQQLAEDEVNGELGRRYAVPFDTSGNVGLASYLRSLCVHIAAEIVYERRGTVLPEARATKLAELRKRLARIATGEEPLSPQVEPERNVIEVISEPSRVHSGSANV